jgi:periplasmic copper chaperone A
MRSATAVAAAAVATLVFAAVASAHVTVNPPEWEAEGFARFAIRVPTERPNAATTKVSMKLPEGVFFVSFQPKPGWKREVKMAKLDEPVEVSGDEVTERVDTVTWTGGRIKPGEFDEFGMSLRMPEQEGQELAFPTVQTYSSGEVVRWIGEADSEEPAPRVKVLAAAAEEDASAAATPEATPAPAAQEDDGGSDTLAVAALVVGAAGLVAGIAALTLTRRRARAIA